MKYEIEILNTAAETYYEMLERMGEGTPNYTQTKEKIDEIDRRIVELNGGGNKTADSDTRFEVFEKYRKYVRFFERKLYFELHIDLGGKAKASALVKRAYDGLISEYGGIPSIPTFDKAFGRACCAEWHKLCTVTEPQFDEAEETAAAQRNGRVLSEIPDEDVRAEICEITRYYKTLYGSDRAFDAFLNILEMYHGIPRPDTYRGLMEYFIDRLMAKENGII